MATTALALGKTFDIAPVIAVVDGSAGAVTGNRVHMANAAICTFVAYFDAGTAGDDLDLDVQEHNASSGGTSQDLDVVTTYYYKSETTLDNDETWTKYTQTEASEVNDATGEAGTSAEEENLVVIEVHRDQLSDGFDWISVDKPDFGAAGTKFGGVLAILSDLDVQRAPENLAAPQ